MKILKPGTYFRETIDCEYCKAKLEVEESDVYQNNGNPYFFCLECKSVNKLNKEFSKLKGKPFNRCNLALECKFNPAYSSKCDNPQTRASGFCEHHLGIKCSKEDCPNNATYECSYAGQFVCGAPWCSEHKCKH